MSAEKNIESVLTERRLFAPPAEFSKQAHLKTVAEVSPDSSGRLALADYYVVLRRSDEAKKLYQEIASKDEAYFAQANLRLAALAVSEGNRG